MPFARFCKPLLHCSRMLHIAVAAGNGLTLAHAYFWLVSAGGSALDVYGCCPLLYEAQIMYVL